MIYIMYIIYICRKYMIMVTVALQKKRKNIDLPVETLQKLSIMAASQGKSLKAYIENILVAKADTLQLEVQNPSPSDDEFFSYPENLNETVERVNEYKRGKTKSKVILKSVDDINNFINNL